MSSIAKNNNAFNSFKNFFTTLFGVDIEDEKNEFDRFINNESNKEDAKIALELQQSLLAIENAQENIKKNPKPKKNKNLSLNNVKIKSEKSPEKIIKKDDEREISE